MNKLEKDSIIELARIGPAFAEEKFYGSIEDLVFGQPIDAALGLEDRLNEPKLHTLIDKAVEGIQEEVDALALSGSEGAREVKDWLHYIRHEQTSEREFPNGVRDKGRGALNLGHFLMHPCALKANLSEAHVVALRLYTTRAFRFINKPLRDSERHAAGQPCPLPVSTYWADHAIKKLRAVNSVQGYGESAILWRGMQNRKAAADFVLRGGTELAFLSTTSDLAVAVSYSLSKSSLFFKIVASNFLSTGVDVQWLSAFPGESEKLYPPLTFLQPTGRSETVSVQRGDDTLCVTVMEVRPTIC